MWKGVCVVTHTPKHVRFDAHNVWEVHTMDRPFIFNPPTASEMVGYSDTHTPEHDPYSLRRQVLRHGDVMLRSVGPRPKLNEPDERERVFYVYCKRSKATRNICLNEIVVKRLVTGTRQVDNHGHVTQVEDFTYYWPNDAKLVEVSTEWSPRVVQIPFCSYKCMSLWTAKLARDTET